MRFIRCEETILQVDRICSIHYNKEENITEVEVDDGTSVRDRIWYSFDGDRLDDFTSSLRYSFTGVEIAEIPPKTEKTAELGVDETP